MLDISKQSIGDMRALLREIRRLSPEVRKRLQRKLRASVNKTAEKARSRQPDKSGRLRKSTRAGARAGQAEIRSKAEYARTIERGGRHLVFGRPDSWVYQKPQPAIFPSVVEDQEQYTNDANRAFDEAAKEIKFL